jgi:hypothetical protein
VTLSSRTGWLRAALSALKRHRITRIERRIERTEGWMEAELQTHREQLDLLRAELRKLQDARAIAMGKASDYFRCLR